MKEYIGFVQAGNGDELWVNTIGDEPVKMVVKDKELREKIYRSYVKITVEEITEEEALKHVK